MCGPAFLSACKRNPLWNAQCPMEAVSNSNVSLLFCLHSSAEDWNGITRAVWFHGFIQLVFFRDVRSPFQERECCLGDDEGMGQGSSEGCFLLVLCSLCLNSHGSASIWRNSSLVTVPSHQLGMWWQVKHKAVIWVSSQIPAGTVCSEGPTSLFPGDTEGKTKWSGCKGVKLG